MLFVFQFQTESPLLVRPYLPYITKSELHAVMTAGFSTIAGSVLGAYISFGVSDGGRTENIWFSLNRLSIEAQLKYWEVHPSYSSTSFFFFLFLIGVITENFLSPDG